jgi:hypothetical protein
MLNIEKERRDFEAYMANDPGARNGLLERWDNGSYKMHWVQLKFEGWLGHADQQAGEQEKV